MTESKSSGMRMKKTLLSVALWCLALIITLSSAVYQRLTGPTHPVRGSAEIIGRTVRYSLPRTETVETDAPLVFTVPDTSIRGYVTYKRYKSFDEWQRIHMKRSGDELRAYLPNQPAAGKIMYYVFLESGVERVSLTGEEPVLLRYKGFVPLAILIPHVIIIFFAMFLSNRTALEAVRKTGSPYSYMCWTIGFFFVGGLILGPLVQKYAFGAFWTGFPFGTDLTDNKTLIAFVGWILALFFNRGERSSRGWILCAALLMLAVYLIPHSLLGSEIDYTKIPQ